MNIGHGQTTSENQVDQYQATQRALENSITVLRGVCPISGRPTVALYEGDLPIIPATIYLLHLGTNEGLATNSVLTSAYALKAFFIFLRQRKASFWMLRPDIVVKFKDSQIKRATEEPAGLRHQTIRQYLMAVKGLINYWRAPSVTDPFLFNYASEVNDVRVKRRGRGQLLHVSWYSRVSASVWHVNIPVASRQAKHRYKGLTREQSARVMEVLNRRPHRTPTENLLYFRDRAIWTFSLMSCLRKGEIVRIRIEDACRSTGVITLDDRGEDRWLGCLKTGPGEVYVTSENPYWSYLESWLMHGRPIAEGVLAERGLEDHGFLFCNCDGGPLTQAAIDHLFERLRRECGLGKDVPLHHHVARHTMATLLLESGVALTEIQKYLRHRSIQSTEIYATVTTGSLRRSLDTFWASYKL